MKLGNLLAQRPPFDKSHGVERMVVLLAAGELIHGNDVGMFQLPGHLRFLQEPAESADVGGPVDADFLQGDLAVEVGIVRQPDPA